MYHMLLLLKVKGLSLSQVIVETPKRAMLIAERAKLRGKEA